MSAQLSIVGTENKDIDDEISFSSFWAIYPRREAKKDAARAWSQVPVSIWPAVITAAVAWRRVWAGQGRETNHIPLPATWLRGERWEDELPVPVYTHQSQMPVEKSEPFVKGELPPHVRELIAKLKVRR